DALCTFNYGCYVGTCEGAQGCTNVTRLDGTPCSYQGGYYSCIQGICYDGSCHDGGPTPAGTPCNDHNPCTTDEASAGETRFETPVDCGNDGDRCDGIEYCDCYQGCTVLNILADCDDGNICTDDSCDPETGCHHVNNAAPCDDGNACTAGDICADALC